MREFIIATDADSELLLSYAEEKGIPVFPMPVTIDGVEYDYDLGRTPAPDVFEALARGASVSTSCKSPWEVKQWFLQLLEQCNDILYIGFSHQLSLHFQNCQSVVEEIKQERPDANIVLIDTLSISAGQSILIAHAVQLREEGKGMDEVAQWVRDNVQHSCTFFSVDDLNYLKRGGRLSGGAAFFGTVLDLKPILHTTEEGKLEPVEKIKGRKKAWNRMAELLRDRAWDAKNGLVILAYSSEENGAAFRAIVQEVAGAGNIMMWPVGPVIGGHVGPNVMGMAFMGEKR